MNILLLNMRIATIIFGIVLFAINFYYYKQGRLKFSTRTAMLCCYFFALVSIAAVTALIRPITYIPRSICILCLFCAIHIVYIIVNQFVYGQSLSIFRNSLFIIFTLSISIELILIFIGRDNLNSFLDYNENYNLDSIYYLTQIIIFIYPIVVHIVIIKILIDGLRGKNINSFIRGIFALAAFCLSLTWWSLGFIKINLLVFGINDHKYLDYFMIFVRNLVLPINIPPFIPLLNPWLCKKISPLYIKLEKERLHWLTYLHTMKKSILVSVDNVPESLLNEQRILTELGDMRELLWSVIPHRCPLSIQAEAEYIHQLLRNQQTITDYGQYAPHTARFNSASYNVKVSKHLYKLEAS